MKLTIKVVSFLTIMLVLISLPAITTIWRNQQKTIVEQARIRALTLYQMITITRQWVAENGHRIEPVPAVATKELAGYAGDMANFRFNITSDQLINPENAPNAFEKRAIAALKQGAGEFAETDTDTEFGRVYYYAAPLYINESCLSCHSYQGYKQGDFRGLISVMIPLSDLEESIKKNNSALIATMFIGLSGIIIAVSFLLYRLVLRPLDSLTGAVRKVEEGDYSVRADIHTDDEIEELSQAFNVMSSQIAHNEDILKAKLDEAVQKYVDLVGELRETNAKLGSLNQLKTDLLDSIAHEIRTPLTKIMSYSELLNDSRVADAESRAQFSEALKRNVASMTAMFNDLITLSRLEHDQHEYQQIPIFMRELIEGILYVHERDIAEKGLTVNLDISEELALLVDGETFRYSISNIITNAIKYTRKEGLIDISLSVRSE
ncbi:MAG: DUF3365 domain-containing protein, partial [Deferribacteraceae bacterium]|nr:DUF3365 domain-containing protein [Deferribacteraceae bacterium]